MRPVKLSLLLTMIVAVAAFPQKITKINRPYVLIDVSASSGVAVGNKLNVVRQIGPGQEKTIGKVEIVVFKQGKCAGKIISETSSYPMRVGDQIQLQQAATNQPKTTKRSTASTPTYRAASSANYLPTYLSVAAGVAAFGASYYYWDQAEQSAKSYDAMSMSDKSNNHDSIEKDLKKYDALSNSFGAVGGALITAGIAYYLFNRSSVSSLSSNIDVQPIYASNYKGMNLSLSFNHPKKQ